jgi:hypothetical protein
MAFAKRQPSPPEHSVEMSRNARGVVQFSVTVRGADPSDCHSEAERLFDALNAAYPYPDTNGGES